MLCILVALVILRIIKNVTRFKKSANKFCCKDHEPLNMELFTDCCIMCSEKVVDIKVVVLRCKCISQNYLMDWYVVSR